MLTPAQRHFQKVMAERRGQADEESDIQRTAHEQILHRLRMDLSRLSGVQSEETKAEMKKSMLPEYEGWIEGTLDGDSGRQDEVITRLMVWAIDCRDYPLAMRLGRYVVRHGLTLPDNFNRTAATFLTEEMSKPLLTLAAADADADLSSGIAVLDEVADIVADSDMPDVVRAKLCKARGLARRGATDITAKAEALALFREAITRNPNAGVKKEIATLARDVKKLSAEGGTNEGGAASTDKTDGTAEPVPEKTSADKTDGTAEPVPEKTSTDKTDDTAEPVPEKTTTDSATGTATTRKTTTKTATGKATKRKATTKTAAGKATKSQPASQKKN